MFIWGDTFVGQYGRPVHEAPCPTIPEVMFRVSDCVVYMLDLSLRCSAS